MNEKKFDSKGNVYVKGRPAYPEKMFEYLLYKKVITPDTIVADVGSGTGIFTSQIAPLVSKVFLVHFPTSYIVFITISQNLHTMFFLSALRAFTTMQSTVGNTCGIYI